MIPIEILKQVTHVYVHGRCPDGLASAMILNDAFKMLGMSPPISFLTHNTEEHRAAGREVTCSESNDPPDWSRPLFCDIAPHPDYGSVRGCLDNGAVVLDHHVGVKKIVEQFGELGVYADAEKEPGVSGAVLAFREVWKPIDDMLDKEREPGEYSALKTVLDFAYCIGARDTGQTGADNFQRGQYMSKALMSRPACWWLDGLEHSGASIKKRFPVAYLTDLEVEQGRALFEAHEEAVSQALGQIVRSEVPVGDDKGGVILLNVFQEQASGFRLCSDVAWALAERPPHFQAVVAGFYYAVDRPGQPPKLCYSLRGLGGFDVQKVAEANGGNGHKAAAGFTADPAAQFGGQYLGLNPYEYIRFVLEEFLRGQDRHEEETYAANQR